MNGEGKKRNGKNKDGQIRKLPSSNKTGWKFGIGNPSKINLSRRHDARKKASGWLVSAFLAI